MTKWEKIFAELQAIQKGHFLLTSGLHSDTYVQCARILERPDITAKLCRNLMQPWKNKKITLVAGPAVGGIILSYELARLFKARNIYTERVDGQMTLRRGFEVNPNDRIIVAEDVITTGGSVKEVVDAITRSGARVMGIVSLVDRRPNKSPGIFGCSGLLERSELQPTIVGSKSFLQLPDYKFNSIIKVNPPVYKPEECPLCKQGIPAVKPGSRGLK